MCTNLLFQRTTTQTTTEAPDEGWEFVCQACGYRARYVQDTHQGALRLEVLNIGNAQARHISSKPESLEEAWGRPPRAVAKQHGEPAWLAPESLRRMEEILQGLD